MKINTRKITREFRNTFYRPFYLLLTLIVLCSHNLYVKMETYFLQPNQEATLSLFNGTFEKSENIIIRDRMLDASMIAQGKRVAIAPDQWKDQDTTLTKLTFTTGKAGTYVAGVSTKARNIKLTAEKFNNYLKHDGVLDLLEQRTKDSLLNQDAVESYEKHVKAIYQVGDIKTNDWSTVLGYPIEFVPKANPYEKYNGEKLEVQLLLDGKPLTNQLVYADYIKSDHTHSDHDHADGKKHSHDHDHADGKNHSHEHSHKDSDHDHADGKKHSHEHEEKKHSHGHTHANGKKHSHGHTHADEKKQSHDHDHADGKKHSHNHTHTNGKKHSHEHANADGEQKSSQKPQTEEAHTHTSGQQLRTNDQGIVTVNLPEEGIYYLRTIHLTRVADSDALTHRSKWATLTFEVSHKHDASTHTHDHEHEHEGGIPTWVFVLGSLAIIGVLFLVFRKKN